MKYGVFTGKIGTGKPHIFFMGKSRWENPVELPQQTNRGLKGCKIVV